MQTDQWAIYNGEIIKADKPVVPVESRGLMYGDGCFETFRVYKGQFFKLYAHLERMHNGLSWLGMRFPADLKIANLKPLITKLLKRNKLLGSNAVLRIQVWREGARGYRMDEDSKVSYSILATGMPKAKKAVRLATVDIKRIPSASLPSSYKLCNNINYIAATARARDKGADDALMQTITARISETTIGNLFWVSGTTVFSPSEECDLLPGITRQAVFDLVAEQEDMSLQIGEYEIEHIRQAEAVWMTNSVRGLRPVKQIDKRSYPVNHPVFGKLKQAFADYISSNLTD